MHITEQAKPVNLNDKNVKLFKCPSDTAIKAFVHVVFSLVYPVTVSPHLILTHVSLFCPHRHAQAITLWLLFFVDSLHLCILLNTPVCTLFPADSFIYQAIKAIIPQLIVILFKKPSFFIFTHFFPIWLPVVPCLTRYPCF